MLWSFEKVIPQIAPSAYIASNATVLGNVHIGVSSSVWYQAVIRGDVGRIDIGQYSNIQDQCVIHVTHDVYDVVVEDYVTVGHRALLHGCTIQHHVLVGMNAVVMDGAQVQPYCLIAANTLIPPGKNIPEHSLVMGIPGKVVRAVTPEEIHRIHESAIFYQQLATRHQQSAEALNK